MALTEAYVSDAGAGTLDGTSEANAFSLTLAIADSLINGAGKRYNVKKGGAVIARAASDTFSAPGTIAAPCVWRGYATTIGDSDLGRNADGTLNVTNMPTLEYASTFRLIASGAYGVYQGFVITGTVSAAVLSLSGAAAAAIGCKITNASTNSAGAAAELITGGAGSLIDCDLFQTGASGAAPAATMGVASALVQGCRIKSTSGAGILFSVNHAIIADCIIYGCGTNGITTTSTSASAYFIVLGCTIYGCAGNGIDIISTSTAPARIIACHITDNGGYGVDANAATTLELLVNTRTRNNTTAAHLLDAEWTDVVHGAITTDTGGIATDYEDAGALDFRLISAAPGRDTTAMGQNAGACGNKYPASGLQAYASA